MPKPEDFILSQNLQGEELPYKIYGERYKRTGAPPIILAHGILNSYGILKKWAHALYLMGYDVWIYNHPGFGQTDKVSVVNPAYGSYEPGDYGFKGLIQGLDQMIDLVREKTRRTAKTKPTIMGFSMGGMNIYQYLSGTQSIDRKGHALREQSLSTSRQNKISHAIFIGAPPFNLDGLALLPKVFGNALFQCLDCLLPKYNGFVDLGLGNEQAGRSSLGKALDMLSLATPKKLLAVLAKDAVNLKNLDPDSKEFNRYLANSFSNVHTDILRDFGAALNNPQKDAIIPITGVDTLFIAGTKDGLANSSEISKFFAGHVNENPHHRLILADHFGHLDLMDERAIQDYGLVNMADQFLKGTSVGFCRQVLRTN